MSCDLNKIVNGGYVREEYTPSSLCISWFRHIMRIRRSNEDKMYKDIRNNWVKFLRFEEKPS